MGEFILRDLKVYFKEFLNNFNASFVLPILGLFLLGYWLLRTSLGRRALLDSRPRRNALPIFLPGVFVLLWLFGAIAAVTIIDSADPGWAEHQNIFAKTVAVAAVNIIFTVIALLLAKKYFARGLKGFGIKFKKIHRDILYAAAYLFAVWPAVIAVLQATALIGKLIYGGDYQVQPHEEIKMLRDYSQFSVQTAIFISGAIITPVFEEIMFRGLIQSTVRSYVLRPWITVFISSVVFTVAHPRAHWAAVFVLGVLMGYAYEKSGSLLRPIFIHAFFNGLTLAIAMTTA